ncbi:MAG: hypothetical protein WC641_03250 [Patescibacteria group bacterium]
MLVNTNKLKNVKVRTKSGISLGRLASLDLDADSGHLISLHVRTSGMLPGLMDEEALVAWSQVLSMSEKEIVVTDAFVTQGATWIKKRFAAPSAQFKERTESA